MIKYLLDTHVVLWVAENSPSLSEKAKSAILDTSAEKYVSIASAWEVAIKLGTTKLDFTGGLPEFYKMIDSNGFMTLPIERKYLINLQSLPNYHKDPFDRLIVSTAIAEDMTLITVDENIHRYDLSLLW
ncbi:MAG: type II toxin-antitoxin system VapC family toxin [Oscillospiraceae bacterium]|nr:type II toxin-antitoxin system VapC family toxin [Oscillospiraceae bacterium]